MFIKASKRVAAALAISFGLTACGTTVGDYTINKQVVGGVLGGVGGGLLGDHFGDGNKWATIAGALIGAGVGNEIGKSLDRADQMAAQQAFNRASVAPIGKTIQWENPNSGNSGTITATQQGRATTGEYCREYQTTVTVAGKTQQAYGTACQMPDGSWQLVNN